MSYTERAVAAGEDFRIGDVFGLGFSILRKHLAIILGLSALFYMPMLVFTAIGFNRMGQGDIGGGLVMNGIGTILSLVFGFILLAAVTYATIRSLQGREVTFGGALQQGLGRFLAVLGVSIVVAIMVGIGMLLLVIPGLIIATLLYVSVPAVVVERKGVLDSLARSSGLTRGHRWKVFGIIVLLFLFNMALNLLVTLIAPAYNFSTANGTMTPEFSMLNLILTAVAGIIVYAFNAIFPAVTYYKLRTVKEGVDVDQIASVFD